MTTPTPETVTPPAPAPEEALFNGGPAGDGSAPPVQTELPLESAPPEPKKPLYEGIGVTISTPEELIDYTRKLEKQAVEATLAAGRTPTVQPTLGQGAQNQSTSPDPAGEGKIEELLFSDPKKAANLIKEQAKADIRKELRAKEDETKFWDGFYDEHPDLRNAQRVVQSITREKWNEVSNLPLAEAKKVLAKESRSLIAQIRGETGTRTELSRTAAATLPSSGGGTPAKVVVQDEPTTFVAEVRNMKARRRA